MGECGERDGQSPREIGGAREPLIDGGTFSSQMTSEDSRSVA